MVEFCGGRVTTTLMYQKYTTEGFLVWARGSGEADRNLLFYTKEFGMILAHATSVRSSKSKLRTHITIGVLLSITLLRSKSRWKITEAIAVETCPPLAEPAGDGRRGKLAPKSAGYKTFAQILTVVKSLVHGEEKNDKLFGALSELHFFLFKKPGDSALAEAECLAMIKILHALGYGEPKSEIADDASYNDETFLKIKTYKKELISGINKALAATGL